MMYGEIRYNFCASMSVMLTLKLVRLNISCDLAFRFVIQLYLLGELICDDLDNEVLGRHVFGQTC